LGLHHRTVGYFLSPIQDYCLEQKLPPLTILVVGKGNRRPGRGFIAWDIDDPEEGFRRVYEFPWENRSNPFALAADGSTPEELAERLVAHPSEADDIYARVCDRGTAQVVFRQALLRAYDERCVFCGLSLSAALQAAHIIPWRAASPAQRLDPSNGLLLCSTHHALFDAGVLSVGLDRRVRCHPGGGPGHAWNDTDHQVVSALDGRGIRTPQDLRLRPSDEALAYRASHPRSHR
jgi:putative restriction endonuclease